MTPFEIARGYIGTTEGPGPENNPIIMAMYASVGHNWVEHDSVAWCAAFVGHCLERAGIRSTRQLTARSYLGWGVPVEIADAQPGDNGVIPRGTSSWQGHVFFIDRIEGPWVWGLGGNQSDAVNVKRYPVSKLLGVRRAGNVAPAVSLNVREVQTRLKDLGYHEVGTIDGVIGPRTRAAALMIAVLGLAAPIALVMILGGFGEQVIRSIERLTRGLATVATGDPSMESSTGLRLIMYRAGIAAWMESPIWGYGVSERFSAVMPHLPEGYSFRFTHLHNSFLTHAVAGGAVGVAVLVSLLLTPLAINQTVGASDRDQRFFAWLIFLSMAGVGMSNLILNHDVSAHFLALLMLVHLLLHHEKRQTGRSSNQLAMNIAL